MGGQVLEWTFRFFASKMWLFTFNKKLVLSLRWPYKLSSKSHNCESKWGSTDYYNRTTGAHRTTLGKLGYGISLALVFPISTIVKIPLYRYLFYCAGFFLRFVFVFLLWKAAIYSGKVEKNTKKNIWGSESYFCETKKSLSFLGFSICIY